MAKQGRRQYTEEFKREAVKLVEEQGRGIAEVARSLGVHRSQVERWRGQYGPGSASSRGGELRGEEAEELKRLRAEVKQLRLEREILKNPPRAPASRTCRSTNSGWPRLAAYPRGEAVRFLVA
ncbi:MAG: transposase [Chromatiaceae bacterium]